MASPLKIAAPPPQTVMQKLETVAALSWDWVQGHSGDILIAAAAGAFLVAALYGLKRLGAKLVAHPDQWRSIIGRALSSMRPWFMVMVAIQIISSTAGAPDQIASIVHILFTIAATIQAAIFMRELIIGGIEFRAGGADATGTLGNAMGLIRLLVSVALFAVAIILILSNIGVNVTGLIAGLGIGGIAIGLAAQGIFSDLFAALAIIFDKPFKRGETVAFETFSGTVEYVGLKSTRLRAVGGEMIVVSNTNLLSKVLRNTTRQEHRRVLQTLALSTATSAETCESLPEKLRTAIDALPGSRFIRCGLENLTAAGLEFKLLYEIEGGVADEWIANQYAANLAVLRTLNELRIDLGSPAPAPAPSPAPAKVATLLKSPL